MRRRPLAVLALLATACGDGAGAADAGPDAAGPPPACEHEAAAPQRYRLFAVGHKVTMAEAESYASYDAAIRQTVATHVLGHLATDRPNVLVFPEDIGLSASFIGPRGASGRARKDILSAYAQLAISYVDATNVYAELDPQAALGRLLLLGTTDVSWRAFSTTFSSLAKEHGVWVVASTNVGDVEITTDPMKELALGDPDRPPGAPVYFVPDAKVYNQAFLWAPDGTLVGRAKKAYLVDLENNQLDMTPGLPDALGPLGGEAGFAFAPLISRDAWMQDAIERSALRGANAILQHEAWGSVWTTVTPGHLWSPDNLKRSGWGAVQKHPELRVAVAPMLVGNYFDVPFDGQNFAVVDGTAADPPRRLLAQPDDTGWAAIGPWVAEEPADGTLEEKRLALHALGQALLPGGADENGYVAGAVWVDVDVPSDDGHPPAATPPPGAEPILGPSAALAPSGKGRQRSASAARLPDGAIAVAWEDTRFCTGQIVVSRSQDGGASWSEPVRVGPWNRPQHTPSLVALPDGALVVAWQEVLGADRGEIRVSRSTDGGATWSPRVRVDFQRMVDAWSPALAVDAATGDLWLAFVDTRGEPPNRRVYVTRSTDGGATFGDPARVDPRTRPPDGPDATYTNEWSPAIAAAGGRVVVAYTHRHRPDPMEQPSNDVHVIESQDRGATWGAPVRLDTGGFPERLAADLEVALRPGGGWWVLWSSLRGTGWDADVALASGPTSAPATLPDAEPRRDQWLSAVAPLPGGGWAIAWQDFRNGSNDIYAARLAPDGTIGAIVRVDDGGDAAIQSWRPALVPLSNDEVLVVWEDSRSGQAELRVARGTLP